MSAPRRARKDNLTILHQWITVIGGPLAVGLIVSFVAWFAATFDGVRTDVVAVKTSVGFVEQELGRHRTQLNDIEKQLGLQK